MQEKSAVVIVAAGASRRMQGRDKLWLPLAGRITLARTLDVFHASALVGAIVLVTSAERLSDATALCKAEHWHKVAAIAVGGARRQDSVRIGLDALAELETHYSWVMIHDGARPLVTAEMLAEGLRAVKEHSAVVAAVPVKDTIKLVERGEIHATLDRTQLWTIQTPQIFAFPLIHSAHHTAIAQEDVTDDATLLERLGQHVTIFQGSYANIKITTQEDVLFAEALIQGSIA